MRHAMRNESVAAIARDPRLLSMAQEVFGHAAIPFRATLFDKSPVSNWLVVWHQDTALPLHERREVPGWGPWSIKDGVNYAHAPASALEQVLALRVHLDDSVAENGPLRVLPGTHTLGVLSDQALHDLSTQIAAVECLVRRGGVLAMRPLVVHASSKSQSSAPRRVLHIEYATSAVIADGLKLATA
jgi:ectoine hydroxylase-related dioxygenase (phytanoyl-CoA dioxygenase family)